MRIRSPRSASTRRRRLWRAQHLHVGLLNHPRRGWAPHRPAAARHEADRGDRRRGRIKSTQGVRGSERTLEPLPCPEVAALRGRASRRHSIGRPPRSQLTLVRPSLHVPEPALAAEPRRMVECGRASTRTTCTDLTPRLLVEDGRPRAARRLVHAPAHSAAAEVLRPSRANGRPNADVSSSLGRPGLGAACVGGTRRRARPPRLRSGRPALPGGAAPRAGGRGGRARTRRSTRTVAATAGPRARSRSASIRSRSRIGASTSTACARRPRALAAGIRCAPIQRRSAAA